MGVIVGTAGHIDHGKSQLVKYLTGTDPDRLKEEKERGITIELGYVFMPLPQEGVLAFIDVPGHENFIRQMVAGTATVDCFLLVVAADEGIMPQTREHLDILGLLGVEKGIVAITKCDLVDEEMQELVEVEIEDLFHGTVFQGTPVHRVSTITGQGMEELRTAIVHMAENVGQRDAGDRFRLDIDRVFVLEGFGTIIAGTAISGTVEKGQEVELLPGGERFRVRELRVNSRKGVEKGTAGDRIALNLAGLSKEEAHRGSCVAEPGYLQVRDSLDTSLSLVDGAGTLKRNQRVRFHTGTSEVMARAIPVHGNIVNQGEVAYVHFQLESPTVAMPGDRFVIRNYSPVVTIGGGVILETGTRKVRKKYADNRISHLQTLEAGEPEDILLEKLRNAGNQGMTVSSFSDEGSLTREQVDQALKDLEEREMVVIIGQGGSARVVMREVFQEASKMLKNSIASYHKKNPVSPGVGLSEPSRVLKMHQQWLVRAVIERLLSRGILEKRGDRLALAEHPPEIPASFQPVVREVVNRVEKAGEKGFPLSELDDADLARALIERNVLVDIGDGILSTEAMAEGLFQSIKKEYQDGFTLAELRDSLSVSRKDALRWAEYFDGRGWTVRRGDRRQIRN